MYILTVVEVLTALNAVPKSCDRDRECWTHPVGVSRIMGGQVVIVGGVVSISEAAELREDELAVLASFWEGSSSWSDFFRFGNRAVRGAGLLVTTGAVWSIASMGGWRSVGEGSGHEDIVEGGG